MIDRSKVVDRLLHLFKIDNVYADEVLSEGQKEIFECIVFKDYKRLQIITPTQYGKSLTVALACIIITCIQNELVAVLAPTDEKSKIIMRYFIQHIGDHPLFYSQLEKNTKLERLRMEENKDRIILRKGGGIFVISTNAGNSVKGFESAMGEGARNVILDEAALTPDLIESAVYRMIAGQGNDAFYCKIGNPFYRNHFIKSWRDDNYHHIFIDYHQAIKEGRYTSQFVEEARHKPLFGVLYDCKFPEDAQQDDSGYFQLLKESEIDMAYMTELPFIGEKFIGIDIADGGANFSTIVVRSTNVAKMFYRNHTKDPMVLIPKIQEIAKEENILIDDDHVFPDKTGNVAFCARMNEIYPFKRGINGTQNDFGIHSGERPEHDGNLNEFIDKDMKKSIYINRRAQMYMRLQRWVQGGGKLVGKPYFDELLDIRWKVQSDKQIKIKGKEEMLKDGIASPDVADALALTFAKTPAPFVKQWKQGADIPMTSYGI
jgi:hypothetical protein